MFVYDGIFFNYICRFFLEGYIEILLASLMNIQNVKTLYFFKLL